MGNAQPFERYFSTAIKHTVVKPALGPLALVRVQYLLDVVDVTNHLLDGPGNVF